MSITAPGLVFDMDDETVGRFWLRVDSSADCWPWTGSLTTAGYGNLRVGPGKWDYAHRIAYQLTRGSIPVGAVIDHLCRNRSCCRPEHLDAVPQRVNVRRGAVPFGPLHTRCRRNHDITLPNAVYLGSDGYRRCRACRTARNAQRREQRAAA